MTIKAKFENKSIQIRIEQKHLSVKFPYSQGVPGKSAYQIAVQYGFEGTEEERLSSLVGESAGTFTHTQSIASTMRTINHNLGYNPNYIAVDTAGDEIEGAPGRPSTNTMVITFSAAVSGTAYLS